MKGGSSAPAAESAPLDAARVRFVLVEPASGGNVGASARALKNLGFSRLALVGPRCDPLGRHARGMAVDAADLLQATSVHATLDEALVGARTVVGTSRRTGKGRRPHFRLDVFAGEVLGLARAGELAVVFGREECGLTDEELDRCTHVVHFLAQPDYPSFNLAQAVLLVAYELRRAESDGLPVVPLDVPASHEEREAMYGHLERALLAIGFLQPSASDAIMRRFRRLFGRASLTAREVRMLHGVAQQALWVAGRASDAPAAEDDADGR